MGAEGGSQSQIKMWPCLKLLWKQLGTSRQAFVGKMQVQKVSERCQKSSPGSQGRVNEGLSPILLSPGAGETFNRGTIQMGYWRMN